MSYFPNKWPYSEADYDPNKFDDTIDYGGFNQFGQRRDNQQGKEPKHHRAHPIEHHLHHESEKGPRDFQFFSVSRIWFGKSLISFESRESKENNHVKSLKIRLIVFTQNNQQFGKDQLWLKKFVVHQRHFTHIVGKGGIIMEEIRKFSGARLKYGKGWFFLDFQGEGFMLRFKFLVLILVLYY